MFPSCATLDALAATPEGYWLATERILFAVWEDLVSVVLWLL